MDEPEPHSRCRSVSGGPLDGKPFAVSGYEVWRAWEQVRDNKGSAGGGRAVHRGLRGAAGGQPLQGLEPDAVGNVVPAAGAGEGTAPRWRTGLR